MSEHSAEKDVVEAHVFGSRFDSYTCSCSTYWPTQEAWRRHFARAVLASVLPPADKGQADA